MRKIKFRAKTDSTDEWVYGDLIHAENCYYMQVDGQCWAPVVVNETIGQFTGCFDKHGREIYEGDIVRKRTYNGMRNLPVVFSCGCFHCGFGGGSSTATHPYMLDDCKIEVVGNRWDNPELL